MNTSTDYSNRQVDLEVLQSITALAPTAVSLSSVSSRPKNVAGPQKAVQRYAVVFLSLLGDVHFDASFGTSFMQSIATGTVQNNTQLLNIFALSNASVLRLIAQEDSDAAYGTIPDDERIVDATLSDYEVNVSRGQILLYVTLTLASGTTTDFILPTTVPR